jgi:hypothetical protein
MIGLKIENYFSFIIYTSRLSVQVCKADHAFFIYFMLQGQFSHLNSSKLDPRKIYASYIQVFCAWLRLVRCLEHVHSHDFVWLLLVACKAFLQSYNYIHTEGWKATRKSGTGMRLGKFPMVEESCFAVAAILRIRCVPQISRRGRHKSLRI